jgi:serine/threonine protein kinase
MYVSLEVVEGPGVGERFAFNRHDVFVVGRSDRCHFCIGSDITVGRVHLIIEVSESACRLRDLGSVNRTRVNGVQVTTAELHDGDTIRVGQSVLTVAIMPTQVANALDDRENTPDGVEDENGVVEVTPNAIPGYHLQSLIRSGGMGSVWLAEDLTNGKQVVVKTIRPDKMVNKVVRQLFVRETKISMLLHHPNIIQYFETGEHRGIVYIVMEYVRGQNADELLSAAAGKIPVSDVIEIGRQCLNALEYAHGQNVVHRDIKPGNLLIAATAAGMVVKLADFGLARSFRESGFDSFTRVGEVRGSVQFMPPEQITDCKSVDQRADLFSLGATLYYLLTGEFVWPFVKGEDPFVTILQSDIVPLDRRNVSLPAPLKEAIHRSLKRDPGARYQSAAEMRNALP